MSTSAVTPYKDRIKSVRELFEKSKSQLSLALPKHISVDRLVRVALSEIQKNPALLDCEVTTLMAALHESARLGLEIGGALGHAYLVPFRNNKKNRMEVILIPGYRGLVKLARNSGQIAKFEAHVVHKKDAFRASYGSGGTLVHTPYELTEAGLAEGAAADPGPVVCAYAYAELKDGTCQYEVTTMKDLQKIRNSSKGKDSPAYQDWNEEMQRKAPAKRLTKWLPASVELARAIELDNRAETGLPQDLDVLGGATDDPIDVSATEVPSDVAAKQWLPASVELARAIELAGLDALSDRMEGGDGEQAAAQEVSAEPVLTSPPSGGGKKK